ncbi:MAG TPA: KpsF/GutQ family sugar-phosphate isomerase [Desulfomonilia bacterium]
MTAKEIIEAGKEVLAAEIEGLSGVLAQVDENFARAVDVIASSPGKVILTGVGKSGIVARKIASTLVSLGTNSIYLHPVDGLHGDLGVIAKDDVAIILSNSGNTREITDLLPFLKRFGITLIGITGGIGSQLAKASDIVLSCRVEKEACKLGLAPTTSTTAQLALGDALAVVVSEVKGFGRDDFKGVHPAGTLGRQLMSSISDVMITGKKVPFVSGGSGMDEVLKEMTAKKLGLTLVGTVDSIEGIVTDGDLRRALEKHGSALPALTARDIMTKNPRRISGDILAIEALDMMEKHQITSLLVMDDEKFRGVVHLHDLLGRGNLAIKGL